MKSTAITALFLALSVTLSPTFARTAESAELSSLEALLARHAAMKIKRDMTSDMASVESFGDAVGEDSINIKDGVVAGSEDIATASEDVYAGSVDTVVATEHGIGHAKAIGSAVDGIFKRMIKLPHKRYIWSSTIIQDSTPNAPPPNVNVNELGGSTIIIAAPTATLVAPTFAPAAEPAGIPSVVLAAIVGTAVDASPSDASYKLSPADADALFLAESAFARKKRYVWSTSVIQDGQPGPDPSINDNDLSGRQQLMPTPVASMSNVPSFPSIPSPSAGSPPILAVAPSVSPSSFPVVSQSPISYATSSDITPVVASTAALVSTTTIPGAQSTSSMVHKAYKHHTMHKKKKTTSSTSASASAAPSASAVVKRNAIVDEAKSLGGEMEAEFEKGETEVKSVL